MTPHQGRLRVCGQQHLIKATDNFITARGKVHFVNITENNYFDVTTCSNGDV